MIPKNAITEQLCLACGLCCNGVLFGDVELQTGDDPARLAAAGLPLERFGAKTRSPQPCAALQSDGRCRLYAERPARCRDFGCALFKQVASGQRDTAAALRVIRKALRQAEQVRVVFVNCQLRGDQGGLGLI